MPAIGGREAGYWGQPTSTLDWCERNYEVSTYIAEFWNTLTNAFMIIMAFRGIYDVYVGGFEKRFYMCYTTLLTVGIGSALFHMTLKYEMQLLDELPMVWGGCAVAYCMFEVQKPAKNTNLALAASLVIFSTVFTLTHLYFRAPIILFSSYGLIIFAMVVTDVLVMRSQYSKRLLYFYGLGLGAQLAAVAMWKMDNIYCSRLDMARSSGILPNYLAPLSQLHGWWHLFAGYATYNHIAFCICHRQLYLGRGCHLIPIYFGIFTVQRGHDNEKQDQEDRSPHSLKNHHGKDA